TRSSVVLIAASPVRQPHSRRHGIDHAVVGSPAAERRAEELPRCTIDDGTGYGIGSVASGREAVNHGLRILTADGRQSKERSEVRSPAVAGDPIKNAGGVVDLNSERRTAVVPAREIVEDAVIRAAVDIRD